MEQPGMYQVSLDRIANIPIAEGIHPFSVTDIEEGESKNNNPMWTVTLACLTPGEEGKTVRMWLVLTPDARWKLEQFFDAVGAPQSGQVVAAQFKGKKLRAQITHEKFEGREQARVGEMWPMAAAPKSSVPPTVAVKAAVNKTTGKTAGTKVTVGKGLPADATTEEPSF